MGYRFYLSVIQKESCLQQGFAVTGRAGADNMCLFGKQLTDLLHGADRCL